VNIICERVKTKYGGNPVIKLKVCYKVFTYGQVSTEVKSLSYNIRALAATQNKTPFSLFPFSHQIPSSSTLQISLFSILNLQHSKSIGILIFDSSMRNLNDNRFITFNRHFYRSTSSLHFLD
jgi:hypothetical protein